MVKKHILIIGKSPLVLKTSVEMLIALGHAAEATDNFETDIATRFDLKQFDLVMFGGQVPPDRKVELQRIITGFRPDVIFVLGLAGIPGLIVQQVQGAFAASQQDQGYAPQYKIAERAIVITLMRPAPVTVTAWWQTTFVPPNPGSDCQVLINKQLDAGQHRVAIPAVVPGQAAFASVQIGEAIYCFSLAGQ